MAETRLVDCSYCGGDGSISYPVDIDRRDGSVIEHSYVCPACAGGCTEEIELQPITLEDLEELSAPLDPAVREKCNG